MGVIIEANSPVNKAEITKIEAKINKLFYQLYGLTEEEIGIVEGK